MGWDGMGWGPEEGEHRRYGAAVEVNVIDAVLTATLSEDDGVTVTAAVRE